jgi:subtilisin family serine protease
MKSHRATASAAFIVLGMLFLNFADCAPPIRLKSGPIDTGKQIQLIPHQKANRSQTAFYIIQGHDRSAKRLKKEAIASGARIISYLPDNAFLIEASPARIRSLRSRKSVRWIGRYKPEYRLAPKLRSVERPEWITILLPRGPALKRDLLELARNGIRPSKLSIGKKFCYLKAKLDPLVDLDRIVKIESVLWIEPFQPLQLIESLPTITGDVLADIMNIEEVWSEGIDGTGQLLGICDTGLDVGIDGPPMHNDIEGRIAGAYALGRVNDWSDDHGHGTHVAGTAVGDGTMSAGLYCGAAYGSELVFQSAYVNENDPLGGLTTDLYPLFEQAYDDGVRVHSNSWGSPDRGRYSIYSEQVDRFMWDHKDMLLVFAAGNDGIDNDSDGVIDDDSLYSPATAKNCLTVGASENVRISGGLSGYTWGLLGIFDGGYSAEPIYSDYISDNQDGMAAFSSRGPCDDGRTKPDIVAPGTDIISCRTQDPTGFSLASYNTWGVYDDHYVYMGGTSMAAPAAAGSAVLARQFLVERKGQTNPSAALVKATLINGAFDMTPGQYGSGPTQEMPARPNNAEGWGGIDLYNSLFASAQMEIEFIDQSPGLDHGETQSWQIVVGDSAIPFHMTLVYTDYPGNPAAAIQLVNDLDAAVIDPLGMTHYPNRLDGPDRLNNIETIDIDQPLPGVYNVIVTGYNIPFGLQPFALVFAYGKSSSAGQLTLNKTAYGAADTSAAVTVIDADLSGTGSVQVHLSSTSDSPGETITLTESISNPGIFSGQISLTTSTPASGEIQITDGDTLTALYHDLDRGDSVSADVAFTASVDLICPVISNVTNDAVGVTTARIQWDTSEMCNAKIVYGLAFPLSQTARVNSYALSHTITLSSLQPNTRYYFKVESSDPAGNLVTDDNSGGHYTFATRYGSILFSDDMENGANGWTHSGDFDQWELGVPTYPPGPASANSPSNCWGTDLDSWFHHDDFFYGTWVRETLISPPIQIDQSTGLSYWYWYDLVPGSDQMTVEISADGGSWVVEDVFDGSTYGQWLKGFINLSAYVNKTFRIRFEIWADVNWDELYPYPGWYIDDVEITSYNNFGVGSITLDRRSYALGTPVIITVVDGHENTAPAIADTVTVTVTSVAEPVGETIILIETDPTSGIFQATFDLTTSAIPGDGKLGVTTGGQITAQYIDLDDGAGSYNVLRSASSDVDLSGPGISSVSISNISSSSATVTFNSEPNSTAIIKYGPGSFLDNEQSLYSLDGGYSFALENLTDNMLYSLAIILEDESGNTVTFDSPAANYRFGTLAARTYALNNFDTETDALNFTSDNSVWEMGMPEIGPSTAYSAPNCWATDLDGPYPINCDVAITSDWITIAPNSFLSFNHWYSINEYLLEDAYGVVEISTNGSAWTNITPDPIGYIGASGGWLDGRVDLTSYGGSDAKLRFRLYSLESEILLYYYEGWYIDDTTLSREIDYGKGSLFFDRNVYSLNTPVEITLIDAHLNIDPTSADTLTLTVSATLDTLDAQFTETAANSGKFKAVINLDNSAPTVDELLQVNVTDTITVTCNDIDDGAGSPAVITAQAPVDLSDPLISGISFSDPTDTAFLVSWTTSEPCVGTVYTGKTPAANFSHSVAGYSQNHSILLTALDENSCYYVKIVSTDQAGNMTWDDNSGLLYKAFTKVRKELFIDDFDHDDKGWTHSGTGDEWEKGTPSYGIAYPASQPNCYATDLNSDYPGTVNASLISPAITIESGARLSFKHWYNIEEYALDDGIGLIEVSAGGPWSDISSGGYTGKASSGWHTQTLSLDGQPPGPINFRYRLSANQTIDFFYPGWYIDNVTLYILKPYGYGTLILDRMTYTVVDEVRITLKDGHLNTDPAAIETATASVTSASDIFPKSVTLIESDTASGIFVGNISISEFSGPAALTVADGDIIVVEYTDSDNAQGGFGVVVTVQALVSITDTDGDSLPDAWEDLHGLDPDSAIGIDGTEGDGDSDSLTNFGEYQNRTDPNDDDSDNDGLNDGDEVLYELDPLDPASYATIIAIEFDTPTGTATITWPKADSKEYEIYWTGDMYLWDKVDGPALNDITENPDRTISWTDRGTDPDMFGLTPGDVDQRFYKIMGYSVIEILSLSYDPATGFVQIIWADIPDKTFRIYWTDELTGQPVWNEISGPALADFADLGDTCSWTDRGTDPLMPPTAPGSVQKRFYKILAQ